MSIPLLSYLEDLGQKKKGNLPKELVSAGLVRTATIHLNQKAYSIQQRLPNSKWEDFYWAKDLEEDREVCLVTPNREANLQYFLSRHSRESGNLQIYKVREAVRQFELLNEEFYNRMKEAQQVPSHRSLPIIYGVANFSPQNRSFAILESVAGTPFLQATRDMKTLEIFRLFRELLEGIDRMHEYDLFHRRVKSGNIVVQNIAKKPTAKFLSWGLAISKEKGWGDQSGARHYLAPEILLKGEVTEQADLWALCSLLCKALTGGFPFPARKHSYTIQQLMVQASRETLPTEFKIRQACRQSKKLQELLFGLLHPNPKKRIFKNARQVINFIDSNWPEVATVWEDEQTTEMITL